MIPDDGWPSDAAGSPPSPARLSRVFGSPADPLAALRAPRGIVVLGAADESASFGRQALAHLQAHPGQSALAAVHPLPQMLGGVATYPTLADVTGQVDLALIAGDTQGWPAAVAACVARGVSAAIVLDPVAPGGDGFAADAWAAAQAGRVRLIGPGALGFVQLGPGLDASTVEEMPPAGSVALVGQGRAATLAALALAARWQIGLSVAGGIGDAWDVGWADLIDSLGNDPATRAIVLVPESLGDAQALLTSARAVAARTPVIVVRSGSAVVDPSAASFGADAAVWEAACRRAGVTLVDGIAEALPLADALARSIRPRGDRLAVVADAAGPTDLVATACPDLQEISLTFTPPRSPQDAESWAVAVAQAASDPATGGVLVVRSAEAEVSATDLASALAQRDRSGWAPVLASLIGEPGSAPAAAILRTAGIPTFAFPDIAARILTTLRQIERERAAEVGTGDSPGDENNAETERNAGEGRRQEAGAILDRVVAEGRTTLDEIESKSVLAGFGLPMVRTRPAATDEEAVAAAETLGYPVALKLYSRTVAARRRVGGVRLDLPDPDAVRGAFWGIEATVGVIEGPGQMLGVVVEPMLPPGGVEVAVRGRIDPDFGPVIELAQDGTALPRAVDLAPLTRNQARRLIAKSGLLAHHMPPSEAAKVAQLIERLGQFLAASPRVARVELAPVRVGPTAVVALDARVTLHDLNLADEALPRPTFPPLPGDLTGPWAARDGGPVLIRPVCPEDASAIARFADESKLSIQLEWVDRLARSDGAWQVALVVEYREPWTDGRLIVGLARLTRLGTSGEAEVALFVGPLHRGRGFGTEILRRLLPQARRSGLARVVAYLDRHDGPGRHVLGKFGAHFDPGTDPNLVRATLDLNHLIEPDPDPDHPAHSDQADHAAGEPPAQASGGVGPTPESA